MNRLRLLVQLRKIRHIIKGNESCTICVMCLFDRYVYLCIDLKLRIISTTVKGVMRSASLLPFKRV